MVGAMASRLITRLDRWLSKHRPAFYKSLKKGVSKAAIAKAEKALGKFPRTLAALPSSHRDVA